MKKILFASALFLTAAPFTGFSQDAPKEKKSEEIIIRSKGDKDMQLKVEVNGDKITINGKPLSEFKDENVTINKRKMIIRDDNDRTMELNFDGPGGMEGMKELRLFGDDNMKEEVSSRPFLGVSSEKPDEGSRKGARVTQVTEGSAAEKAGIKEGDLITKINDQEVNSPAGLSEVVKSFKPKDEVTVWLQRDGKEKKLKATLGERKEKIVRAFSFSGPDGGAFAPGQNFNWNFNGEGLDKLNNLNMDFDADEFRDKLMHPKQKKLGIKIQDTEDGENVKIINVEDSSAAATAGLQKDDLITEIDGAKIKNTDDAREKLMPEEGKKSYKMKVLRNKQELNIEVKIPRKLKTANL